VQPEHVDDGLARFEYAFADGSKYHLNMFPLRRQYTRRLMHEVGFQKVHTFGDFESDFEDSNPDFLVHICEKHYELEKSADD